MNFYHKAISLAGFVLLTVLPAQAQVRQTREEYINKYKKIAVAHMERYGIPASITMAQGLRQQLAVTGFEQPFRNQVQA